MKHFSIDPHMQLNPYFSPPCALFVS